MNKSISSSSSSPRNLNLASSENLHEQNTTVSFSPNASPRDVVHATEITPIKNLEKSEKEFSPEKDLQSRDASVSPTDTFKKPQEFQGQPEQEISEVRGELIKVSRWRFNHKSYREQLQKIDKEKTDALLADLRIKMLESSKAAKSSNERVQNMLDNFEKSVSESMTQANAEVMTFFNQMAELSVKHADEVEEEIHAATQHLQNQTLEASKAVISMNEEVQNMLDNYRKSVSEAITQADSELTIFADEILEEFESIKKLVEAEIQENLK